MGILYAQTWLLAWNVVWGLYSTLHPSRLVRRLPAAGLWILFGWGVSFVAFCLHRFWFVWVFFYNLHAKSVWTVILCSLDQTLTVTTWLLKCLSVESCWHLNSYVKRCLPKNLLPAVLGAEKLESSYFPAGNIIPFLGYNLSFFWTVAPGYTVWGKNDCLVSSFHLGRKTQCCMFVGKTAKTCVRG